MRAFDLFEEGPKRASKETQTEFKNPGLPSGIGDKKTTRDGSKQMFMSMMPQAAADSGSFAENVAADQVSDNSFAIQMQMQQVEMNENILIESRSQVSSFVVQADRIQSLETENVNLNV